MLTTLNLLSLASTTLEKCFVQKNLKAFLVEQIKSETDLERLNVDIPDFYLINLDLNLNLNKISDRKIEC